MSSIPGLIQGALFAGGVEEADELVVPASIVIGSVQANDVPPAQYDTSQNGNGLWVDYVVHHRYEKDRHTYMAGVTSPNGFNGQSVAFFQLAAPTLLWVVDWTASRSNGKPQIPSFTVPNNWVLLDEWIEPYQVELGPDGSTPLWRISGIYYYGCTNPQEPTTLDCLFPKTPAMLDAFGTRGVPSTLLTNGITTQAAGGGAANALAGFVTTT